MAGGGLPLPASPADDPSAMPASTSRTHQPFARLLPFLGAAVVVVAWLLGADGLEPLTRRLPMVGLDAPNWSVPLEVGEMVATVLLGLIGGGLGVILTRAIRHRAPSPDRPSPSRLREIDLRGRGRLRHRLDELERFADIVRADLHPPIQQVLRSARLLAATDRGGLDDGARLYLGQLLDGTLQVAELLAGLDRLAAGTGADIDAGGIAPAGPLGLARQRLAATLGRSDAVLVVGPLPPVLAVAHDLTEIFVRLLDEAVRDRPPGQRPVLNLAATAEGGMVAFHLRGASQPATAGDGAGPEPGLGLARGLIERMGGRLWRESDGTLAFSLPAALETGPADE